MELHSSHLSISYTSLGSAAAHQESLYFSVLGMFPSRFAECIYILEVSTMNVSMDEMNIQMPFHVALVANAFLYCIYVLCGLRTSISHKTNNDWIRIYRERLELVWFSNNYTILHGCRASLHYLFLSDRGSDYRSRASKGRDRNSIFTMRLTWSI